MKANFTPFPNLTTERLDLRQLKSEDENEFYILKSDERILKYLEAAPKSMNEARRFLHKLNAEIATNECIYWAITLKNENKLIGAICFWNLSEEHSNAEIGYELMPDYQGKGIMGEAMAAVIEYGFTIMKLHSIVAFPNPNNSKSVKLLERSNFMKNSNFKEHGSPEDRLSDKAIYTRINNNPE